MASLKPGTTVSPREKEYHSHGPDVAKGNNERQEMKHKKNNFPGPFPSFQASSLAAPAYPIHTYAPSGAPGRVPLS